MPEGLSTKEQIKAAAQNLFARYGVEGVTVQQIVAAAGQRNNAALHYHFKTKEELVRQLVVDGAMVLDRRRHAMLKELRASGEQPSVRDVLLILVMPVVELAHEQRWHGYIRFTSALQATNREAFDSALENRWNSGYVACFALLKKRLNLPAELVEQRLSLLAIYANAILSARESALQNVQRKSRLWGQEFTIDNIIDTLEATITCDPSPNTSALIARSQTARTR